MLVLLILPYLVATFASPLPSRTLTPAPASTHPIATATLALRCNDGECSYGGTATTLQAATVTSTILTTTSVPCYVTTYVTNSVTVSSTVYSTQTVISTVTSEGTVYVYQYSPTPVLFSSTYESVLEITQTLTTFWQSATGTGYVSTSTEAGGYNSGNVNTWTTTPVQTTGSADAWTHAGGGAAQDNSGTVAVGGAAANTAAAGGWVTAGNNGVTAGGNNGVAVVTAGTGGAVVNWNAASRVGADLWMMLLMVMTVTAVTLNVV